ncbi:MAG: PD40 domain-containing protein, partial [Candidatus Zixiibacteriota bacterium]
RSDIFSFGATLYEMVTGQRAFTGDSKASLIGSIMRDEPRAISELQPTSPPALDRLIKKCLQKDPDRRWQTAGDLRDELDWIASAGSQAGVPTPVSSRRRLHLRLSWSLFAVAGVIAILLAVLHFLRTDPVRKTSRFTISTEQRFESVQCPRISPDGKLLAFLTVDSTGTYKIWIRPLNALEAYPLPGTEGAFRPFWSPDSRYLAYVGNLDQLKKVPVSGGPPQLICEFAGSDGCWGKNGTILFDYGPTDPIMQVPAAGGTPTPATTIDTERGEIYHMWPWFLPDGNHFLYLVNRSLTQGQNSTGMIGETSSALRVGSLDGSVDRELFLSDSRAEYCEPGYILYCAEGVLLARRFDTDRLEVVGEPIPVAENIAISGSHSYHFGASDDATLVYQSSVAGGVKRIIVVDRVGQELDTLGAPADYGDIALSPDGKRLAFDMGRGSDIWIEDLTLDVRSRLTFDGGSVPVWSPDGEQIAYRTSSGGAGVIKTRRTNGTGIPNTVYRSPRGGSFPTDWSHDGQYICATSWGEGFDIVLVDLLDSSNNVSVLHESCLEVNPQISPDGRFLVYQSDESGRYQIYIRELGGNQGKWQVSPEGGYKPVWRDDGREIFYWDAARRLITVPVDIEEGSITLGVSEPLFARTTVRSANTHRICYDVSSDGQRFYINVPTGDDNQMEFVVVLNWDAEQED